MLSRMCPLYYYTHNKSQFWNKLRKTIRKTTKRCMLYKHNKYQHKNVLLFNFLLLCSIDARGIYLPTITILYATTIPFTSSSLLNFKSSRTINWNQLQRVQFNSIESYTYTTHTHPKMYTFSTDVYWKIF